MYTQQSLHHGMQTQTMLADHIVIACKLVSLYSFRVQCCLAILASTMLITIKNAGIFIVDVHSASCILTNATIKNESHACTKDSL